MKRSSKLGALCAIAISSIAAYFGIRVEISRRVIEKYSSRDERGLQCYWRVGDQLDVKQTPSWWQIVRGARPFHVHVAWPAFKSDHKGAREFAASIRFFGSLEEFVVGYDCKEVMTLLSGFGRQSHLTDVHCFHAPVTDEFSTVVRGFPHLKNISLVPSQFTGSGFPAMPDLEAVDLSWSPISAEGFRAIVASPNLIGVKMADHPNPSPSLLKAVEELRTVRPNVDVSF
ncbi:hypothetical protein ACXR0O_06515 [Verrucomicrobiota bacterium sgz303538]